MSGKKFNAAERHFEQKRLELSRKLSSVVKQNKILAAENQMYLDRINSLESENAQLNDWVNRLLQYTELEKDDIKIACEKDKALQSINHSVCTMLDLLCSVGGAL